MVEVPVIKAFSHEGRAFSAGDMIRLSPVEAAVLSRQGYVSIIPGTVVTRDITPEPEPEPEQASPAVAPVKSSRRRYRRRDLMADA